MMNQLEDQVSDLRLLTSSAAIPLEGGIRRSGNSVFPLQRNNTAHSADNSAPSTRRTLSSAPDYAFQPLPTPSVTSAPPSSAPRGTKRKQDNGDGGNVGNSSARPTDAAPVKQTRSKRNRVIMIHAAFSCALPTSICRFSSPLLSLAHLICRGLAQGVCSFPGVRRMGTHQEQVLTVNGENSIQSFT